MHIPQLPSIANAAATGAKPPSEGTDTAKDGDNGDISQFTALFGALSASFIQAPASVDTAGTGTAETATTGKTGKKLPGGLPGLPDGLPVGAAGAKDLWAILSESGRFLPVETQGITVSAEKMAAAAGQARIALQVPGVANGEDGTNADAAPIAADHVDAALGEALAMLERKTFASRSSTGSAAPAAVKLAAAANDGSSSGAETGFDAASAANGETRPSMPNGGSRAEGNLPEGAGAVLTNAPTLGADFQLQTAIPAGTERQLASTDPLPAPAAPRIEGFQGAERLDELVQAISHARETGSTQPVRATVSHGEFGLVALKLTQDDSGLTARLSSADASFAPAAQAAVRAMADSSSANANARGDEHARQHPGAQDGTQQQAANAQQQGFGQGQARQQTQSREMQDTAVGHAPHMEREEPGDAGGSNRSGNGGLYA